MSKRKAKFKIGDTVRVDTPLHVLRVGYPKTIADFKEAAGPKVYEALDLLRKVGVYRVDSRRLKHEIARSLCKQAGFGGSQRSIHIEPRESLRGLVGQVTSIRYCKTGSYVPESSGDGEYDPAYLAGEKTHRLLVVECSHDPFLWLETEDVNVTLLQEAA